MSLAILNQVAWQLPSFFNGLNLPSHLERPSGYSTKKPWSGPALTTSLPNEKSTEILSETLQKSSNDAVITGVVLGISLPAVFVIFLVIFAFICIKKRQNRNCGANALSQAQNSMLPPSSQQGRVQRIMPMDGAIPYSNGAFSTPHDPFPASFTQAGSHSTAPYPISYATATLNQGVHVNTTGNATRQSLPMVTPHHNHIPAGALQSSDPTGLNQ